MVATTKVNPMSAAGFSLKTFENGRELKPLAQSKNEEEIAVNHVNEQIYLVIDNEKMKKIMDNVRKLGGDVDSLSVMPRYKKFETVQQRFTGYFVKYEKIKNKKGDLLDSILWYEADGGLYYHSSVVLVDECRIKGIGPGRFFVGVYEGKPKNTYMKFDIRVKPMD